MLIAMLYATKAMLFYILSTKGVRSIGLLMLRALSLLSAAIDSVQLVAMKHSIYR